MHPHEVKTPGDNFGDNGPSVKRSRVAALHDEMNHMFEIVLGEIQDSEQMKKRGGGERNQARTRSSQIAARSLLVRTLIL